MTNGYFDKIDRRTGGNMKLNSAETERSLSRQETIEWISQSALGKLRLAWRGQAQTYEKTGSNHSSM